MDLSVSTRVLRPCECIFKPLFICHFLVNVSSNCTGFSLLSHLLYFFIRNLSSGQLSDLTMDAFKGLESLTTM